MCSLEASIHPQSTQDSSDPEVASITHKECYVTPTTGHSLGSHPVLTLLDSGSSVTAMSSAMANELGIVEEWTNGPTVRMADGRRVRLRKKTAPVKLQVPMYENGFYALYDYTIRCAVLPGKCQRLLLGRATLQKLKRDMQRKGQLTDQVVPRTGWSKEYGGGSSNAWLFS